jgi:hypothetical protein
MVYDQFVHTNRSVLDRTQSGTCKHTTPGAVIF